MSSIDSVDIIIKMLKNNGVYPGDPPVFAIYQYKNLFNGEHAYKLIYEQNKESAFLVYGQYADEPICLFRGGKITPSGNAFLSKHKSKNNA